MSMPQPQARSGPESDVGHGLVDTSRKTVVACEACRKQKIRCDMPDSKPPCARCRKKRLSCAVSRSLQMHVEHDSVWKREIELKMHQLEAKLEAALAAGPGNVTPLPEHGGNPAPSQMGTTAVEPAPRPTPLPGALPGPIWRLEVDLESSPSSLPGLRLHNGVHALPAPHTADFVSRGVVTLANAVRYQAVYQDRLDHFLYGVLGDRSGQTFAELHRQSPLLSTAVCAVGALHAASDDYEPLRAEFIALTSATSLSRKNDADYVRALCIGAFWMSDLSAALSSLAVRVATELQLHRRLARAVAGDYQAYLDARLYYLVYACDHHLSIPHGRPPLTRQCDAVRSVRRLLECPRASHDDARLVSHVLRWTVWTDIFDSVGQGSVDTALSSAQILTVKRLANTLDSLRLEWADRLGADAHVGNYPWKGASMQHHFAKLYLCSHVFRGSSGGGDNDDSNNPRGSTDADLDAYELASAAVLAATCILRTVNADREVQSFLNGLPTYFHVMIAFAVVFLLKVVANNNNTSARAPTCSSGGSFRVVVDADEIRLLLTRSIAVLRDVTRTMHPRHLLVDITDSAAEAVQRSYPTASIIVAEAVGEGRESGVAAAPAGDHQRSDPADVDHVFPDELLDGFFNTYDFLVDHS
ncbi:hypothetical protein Micbo1qcDRAFT_222137 [Microdochium bolleyi]|uniref:Zn(2)-C6 fungal-type domain-containing protein n=1 Tax=Microdochium bolleyi TaxID=196109 RepID=A0A136IKI5_9PEZI|nr:hypothetical protein Micbo1qcDRAFT_222137 [Microdochium bolleyi]